MLICGSVVLALSLGIRHAFGLFLQPVSLANGWGRETFAFAIALQNLVWGLAQPFAGFAADRIGAGRVVAIGALFYAAGLALMAQPQSAPAFVLAAGLLVGLGLAGTTFPIVFGAISRAMPPERRSMAFGVAMAIGSFGQFVMLPGALAMIDGLGWAQALLVLSALSALMFPLAFALSESRVASGANAGPSARQALRTAGQHRGFWLLSLGFFVCGFQVVFIGTHLPAFLSDRGLPASVASIVLALIGLVNVAGTLAAGYLGGRFAKPGLLAWIYLGRAAAIALFVYLPITAGSAYLFGILMGLFWLSTIPLTNGTIATMFGVRNMSMLGGLVFLAHQVGSFLGGWLGGYLSDALGSYDTAWALTIALSLIAAALNVPIREVPVPEARAEAHA
ncbi:MAG: MFS transporter [Burkholderiales bacterium]|nr:MAG: MFS transporter [Burkholderiales bacterium]